MSHISRHSLSSLKLTFSPPSFPGFLGGFHFEFLIPKESFAHLPGCWHEEGMNSPLHPAARMARPRLLAIALVFAITTLHSRAQNPALTLTNPTPASADSFGYAVATVGNSLLVGNPQDSTIDVYTGAVYLYSSNGILMRTFLNPAPANGYFFGQAIAPLGNDKVLIGAPRGSTPVPPHSGAAYLYHTNGTLIRTFFRPTAQAGARFGSAVATLGFDRIVVGADGDDRARTDAGAAYLFSTNGTLLATFTNSTPQDLELFGQALTAVGSDRVLIGAPGDINNPGSALLFNTNGILLTRFNNPLPQAVGSFGRTVAALGVDKVAISAPFANFNAARAGVVHLFTTNGLLFPPLANPAPTQDATFGLSLAAVGADKLLISSFDQAAGQNVGATYLFSTNNTVLMTTRNPLVDSFGFGWALAVVSPNRVLIGAPWGPGGGTAYVFDLRPSLNLSKTATNTIAVSWPSPWTDWTLQHNTDLITSSWVTAPETVIDDGTNKFILPSRSDAQRHFRLAAP